MELVEFTRIQDDDQGIVAMAEERGRIALVKVLVEGRGSQVTVQVDGEVVATWQADGPPNDELLQAAQTVAMRHLA